MNLHDRPIFQEHITTEKGQIILWKVDRNPSLEVAEPKVLWQRNEVVRMLQSIGYTIDRLHYKPTGQPVLPESTDYISISHTQNWFAIYIATAPVGIDIEVERNTIAMGKDWFINPIESSLYKTPHELQLIWGAKEAYYKKLEGRINDLRNHVTIIEIKEHSLRLKHEEQEIKLFFRKIENTYLVWTAE